MLISYQLTTDKPDVEVSRIQVKNNSWTRKPTNLPASTYVGVQTSVLSEVLSSSTTEIPAIKTHYHIWKLNLNPLLKKNIGGSGQAQLPWFTAGGELALSLTFLNGNILLGKWHEFCLIPILLHIAICSHRNFHLFQPSTRLFNGQCKNLQEG